MFLSILQLISAITINYASNTNYQNLTQQHNVYSLPMVYSQGNTSDSLSVLAYEFQFRPFSDSFIQNEWEKGLNLNNGFTIRSGVTPQWSYLIQSSSSGFQFESNKTYSISFYCENYSNYGLFLDNSLFNGKVNTIYFELGNNATYSNNILFGNFTFNQSVNLPSNVDFISSSMPNNDFNASDLMITNLGYYYPYQEYHSDIELFNVVHNYDIAYIDIYDNVEGIYYSKFLTINVAFSFDHRVIYESNNNRYRFYLDEFIIGVNKWDYDNDFPNYAYLNYFLYSTFKYQGDEDYYYNATLKAPLIYGSPDIYDTNFMRLDLEELGTIVYSTDYVFCNICFEYITLTDFNNMLNGFHEMSGDFLDGYKQGYNVGYDEGYNNGLYEQYNIYHDQVYDDGYQQGFADGMNEVIDTGQTASVIFNGIISVGLLPTNVFLKMLNLEVFGINIGALVSSLLTIMVIIIVVRMIFGGKNEV